MMAAQGAINQSMDVSMSRQGKSSAACSESALKAIMPYATAPHRTLNASSSLFMHIRYFRLENIIGSTCARSTHAGDKLNEQGQCVNPGEYIDFRDDALKTLWIYIWWLLTMTQFLYLLSLSGIIDLESPDRKIQICCKLRSSSRLSECQRMRLRTRYSALRRKREVGSREYEAQRRRIGWMI